jgi:hypothetical protein
MENDNVADILRIGPYACTKEQLRIFRRAGTDGVEIFQRLVWLAIEARDAWVQPPHLNENGEPVKHGANQMMHQLEEIYFSAAQSMVIGLPEKDGRDWFPWMFIRNHRARRELGLPGWMQWLVDKNGGKVPTEWSNDDVKSDDKVGQERLAQKIADGTAVTIDLDNNE